MMIRDSGLLFGPPCIVHTTSLFYCLCALNGQFEICAAGTISHKNAKRKRISGKQWNHERKDMPHRALLGTH